MSEKEKIICILRVVSLPPNSESIRAAAYTLLVIELNFYSDSLHFITFSSVILGTIIILNMYGFST